MNPCTDATEKENMVEDNKCLVEWGNIEEIITLWKCWLHLHRIWLEACGFFECLLEMPDEPILIANALFMWFTKPSLK